MVREAEEGAGELFGEAEGGGWEATEGVEVCC